MRITADIDGADDLKIDLKKLAPIVDIEDTLDQAGAVLINRIRARFLAERDPNGQKWEPSLAGALRKARGGPGTLFDTGTLFHSIHVYDRGTQARTITVDPAARNKKTGDRVADYAKKLQNQSPRRIFLGFSTDDADIVEKIFLERLDDSLDKAL